MLTRTRYTLNGAFPRYAHTVERCVSEGMLSLAKMKATQHFATHSHEYRRVFRQYVKRKLHCKPSAIKFDPISKSVKRIRDAVLVESNDAYGWTDGVSIRVCKNMPMGFDLLVGTLIHEELHCFCKARSNFLGADVEHHCMRCLGDT